MSLNQGALALRVVHTDELPPTFVGRLKRIEQRIQSTEGDGLRARWEFGRLVLEGRQGKKLPKGELDAIVKATAISRLEVQRRLRFASRYESDEALCHAMTQWPTWFQMVRDGLTQKRKAKARQKSVSPALRQLSKALPKVGASTLTEADLKAVDAIFEQIQRIYAELGREE